MNSKVIKLGLLLALSCLILVSLVACRSAAVDSKTETPSVKQTDTPSVKQTETPSVKRGDTVRRVTADGHLSFVEHRRLTFRTSGNVAQVNVKELDRVTKGQVLTKLDTTSLEREVKAAELGVKAAEVALKSAEIDRKQVEDSVKSAAVDLELATDNFRKITYPYTYSTFVFDVPQAVTFITEAKRQITDAEQGLQIGLPADRYYEVSRQLKQALDNLAKGRELLARGQGEDVFESRILPVKDFWTLRAAQLQMDKAQLAVENAKTLLNKAQSAVDKAKNEMDKASNELDIARDEIEKAVIVAPFNGIIAKVDVKEGDFLSSGNYATTIAIEIIDPSRMELAVKVNEIDIPNVKLGQKVTISVDALPEERFEIVVTSISLLPVVEAGVVSYEVKIVFDVPQNSALKAGMGARADIIADKRS